MSAIQDAYNQIGADFSDVLRRFTSEKLIVRFAEKFLEDGSFEQLGEALRSGNADAAFLASHTLKGVSQNMGFTGLYESSNALTEELRAKPVDFMRAKELFEPVEAEYGKTVEALREAGADVLGVVSIFTYGMKKGLEKLSAANVKNVSLTNFDVICEEAAATGYISRADVARLKAFRDNPADESWIRR